MAEDSASIDETPTMPWQLLASTPWPPNDDTNLDATAHFREAQWSADGKFLITNNDDNSLRLYEVYAASLLQHMQKQHPELTLSIISSQPSTGSYPLKPTSLVRRPAPIRAYATYPYFNEADESTTFALTIDAGFAIQLRNFNQPAFAPSYPIYHSDTRDLIVPYSLTFSRTNPYVFYAGATNQLAQFDLSRYGGNADDPQTGQRGPTSQMLTVPRGRRQRMFAGPGIQGIVSALDASRSDLLAAGTYQRWAGVYPAQGLGQAITVFDLRGAESDGGEVDIGGSGATQVLWSHHGSYLYVAERKSDGILLYDMRMMRKLGILAGRKAMTNQRLTVDVTESGDVWAGGTDGKIRVWENSQSVEGVMWPSRVFDAHNDVVTSCAISPVHEPTIVASTSGQWEESRDNADSSDSSSSSSSSSSSDESDSDGAASAALRDTKSTVPIAENSLKLWRSELSTSVE